MNAFLNGARNSTFDHALNAMNLTEGCQVHEDNRFKFTLQQWLTIQSCIVQQSNNLNFFLLNFGDNSQNSSVEINWQLPVQSAFHKNVIQYMCSTGSITEQSLTKRPTDAGAFGKETQSRKRQVWRGKLLSVSYLRQ